MQFLSYELICKFCTVEYKHLVWTRCKELEFEDMIKRGYYNKHSNVFYTINDALSLPEKYCTETN
jgi:hypothetical protein